MAYSKLKIPTGRDMMRRRLQVFVTTLASSRKPAQSMLNMILQAGITYERAGASANQYSIADSVLHEYVNWDEMS